MRRAALVAALASLAACHRESDPRPRIDVAVNGAVALNDGLTVETRGGLWLLTPERVTFVERAGLRVHSLPGAIAPVSETGRAMIAGAAAKNDDVAVAYAASGGLSLSIADPRGWRAKLALTSRGPRADADARRALLGISWRDRLRLALIGPTGDVELDDVDASWGLAREVVPRSRFCGDMPMLSHVDASARDPSHCDLEAAWIGDDGRWTILALVSATDPGTGRASVDFVQIGETGAARRKLDLDLSEALVHTDYAMVGIVDRARPARWSFGSDGRLRPVTGFGDAPSMRHWLARDGLTSAMPCSGHELSARERVCDVDGQRVRWSSSGRDRFAVLLSAGDAAPQQILEADADADIAEALPWAWLADGDDLLVIWPSGDYAILDRSLHPTARRAVEGR